MSDNGKKLLQKAGPGGYDIYVEPAALREAARQFRAVAVRFQTRIAGFPSAAHLPPHAFGVFDAGHDAMVEYDRSRGDAPRGLDTLHQLMHDVADMLDASARNYDTADETSAGR